MKTPDGDFDVHLSSSLKGKELELDLSDAILNRALVIHKKEQRRSRKEAIVIAVYIILTLGMLLVLFLVKRGYNGLSGFSFPELNRLTFSSPDLIIYYRAAIMILAGSLICFATYFFKTKVTA